MRHVCDWLSPDCDDPTAVYVWTRPAHTKYLCAYHGAVVLRRSASTDEPAGAYRFPLAVGIDWQQALRAA